jgi:two-component system response regulator RegX3
MGPASILVVEDEDSIGQGLCDVLLFRGHRVEWAKDGLRGRDSALSGNFDLILLDVMLPELDGYAVCSELRAAGCATGIIMLTAKGSEEDILKGFECGADDYVTKPFSLRQLLARVDALLGRRRRIAPSEFAAGEIRVDASRALLSGPLDSVEVTAREIEVLRLLFDEPGRIVGRRQLLTEVWEMQSPDGVETRTVDVHMAKLRKKLAQVSSAEVQAVRGQGYRLILEGGG